MDLDALAGVTHQGLHVCLRGTGVDLIGERGTRVPRINASELSVAVEGWMKVVYVYDR